MEYDSAACALALRDTTPNGTPGFHALSELILQILLTAIGLLRSAGLVFR